eukprot:NODE_1328_length_1468_cov_8.293164_g1101_i0.p1 GENE.NODE_1328_length_1468_cov_8.293164_g1101_i0~~NODE_1328_length_1468_cov_8.293164_g1101_i0.p1  ORF type:complete len:464 (-),score=109.67 NODE_1328_length_1468_cov_8.293164_g1101_i0:77-1402(-)
MEDLQALKKHLIFSHLEVLQQKREARGLVPILFRIIEVLLPRGHALVPSGVSAKRQAAARLQFLNKVLLPIGLSVEQLVGYESDVKYSFEEVLETLCYLNVKSNYLGYTDLHNRKLEIAITLRDFMVAKLQAMVRGVQARRKFRSMRLAATQNAAQAEPIGELSQVMYDVVQAFDAAADLSAERPVVPDHAALQASNHGKAAVSIPSAMPPGIHPLSVHHQGVAATEAGAADSAFPSVVSVPLMTSSGGKRSRRRGPRTYVSVGPTAAEPLPDDSQLSNGDDGSGSPRSATAPLVGNPRRSSLSGSRRNSVEAPPSPSKLPAGKRRVSIVDPRSSTKQLLDKSADSIMDGGKKPKHISFAPETEEKSEPEPKPLAPSSSLDVSKWESKRRWARVSGVTLSGDLKRLGSLSGSSDARTAQPPKPASAEQQKKKKVTKTGVPF